MHKRLLNGMQFCFAHCLPLHPGSDLVEQALSILVFSVQSMFDYKLPLLQGQLLVELYNLDIIAGSPFALHAIFGFLNRTVLLYIYKVKDEAVERLQGRWKRSQPMLCLGSCSAEVHEPRIPVPEI